MSTGKIIAGVFCAVVVAAGSYLMGKESGMEDGRREGREDGRRESDAKYAEEIANLKSCLAEELKDIAKREDFLLVAYAVGVCSGSVNGNLSREKIEMLDDVILGLGNRDFLSEHGKNRIADMIHNPPSLNSVWALIKKRGFYNSQHLPLFNQVVEVMLMMEKTGSGKQEAEFFKSWNEHRAA